jgi:hypothetical protein
MIRDRILPPYTRRVEDTRQQVSRVAIIGILVLVAMLMGFLLAILPPQLVTIPMIPLFVLLGLMMWMAPDVDLQVDQTVRKLFIVFLVLIMLWPDYIAFAAAGIGWLSPTRIIYLIAFVVSVAGICTSSRIRSHILDMMNNVKPIWWLFIAFFALQALLAFVTREFPSRLFFVQFFWYYMFIIAAWVFSQEGTVRRLYQIILVALVIQAFFAFQEPAAGGPIWGPYVPDFLRGGDPEFFYRIVTGRNRAGLEGIRVKAIYTASLTYAEFLALAIPFVLHAVLYARKVWWQFAALGIFVMIFFLADLNQQRTAYIGIIFGLLLTVGAFGVRRYFQHKQNRDLIGPAVISMYPIFGLMTALSILFVPRIRRLTLGGGEHKPSDNAREAQWDIAINKLQQNPLGYGPFQTGEVVNYRNLAGSLTIDSYPINLLIDYGILGFVLFTAFFVGCAVIALITYIRAETEEEALAGPIAVALAIFLLVKTVLSQTDNHDLVFAMAGAAVALYYRQTVRRREAGIAASTTPFPILPSTAAPPRGAPALAYGRTG